MVKRGDLTRVVPTRLPESEAKRLAEMATRMGKTPAAVLRLLVRLAEIDDTGQVISGGAPLLPAAEDGLELAEVDAAIEAIEASEQAKAALEKVRASMGKQGIRYRL